MEFHEYLTNMRKAQKKGTIPANAKLKDNQTWVPKYTDQEIINMYFAKAQSYGPVSEAMSKNDLLDLMNDWDESRGDYDVPDVFGE